jgi:hypothetical protein
VLRAALAWIRGRPKRRRSDQAKESELGRGVAAQGILQSQDHFNLLALRTSLDEVTIVARTGSDLEGLGVGFEEGNSALGSLA